MWALVTMFPWSDYTFLVCLIVVTGLCNALQPLFVGMLLEVLLSQSAEQLWMGYVYGAVICVSNLARSLSFHLAAYNACMMSLRWRAATVGLVFKK